MESINKIVVNLWFNKEAAEASRFYLGVFKNSRLLSRCTLPGTPSGDVEILTMEIDDLHLMLMSAGPYFKINPSVSFMVSCTAKAEVQAYWDALIDGGKEMMPLDSYDFSEFYGWVEDKFGVSWQIMYVGSTPVAAKIRPALMFVGSNAGRAEEAIKFYTQVFRKAEIRSISRYGQGFPPNDPTMLNFAEFILEGRSFSVMDSAYEHDFAFNEAISMVIHCDNQEEIDYYWDALSADPEAEQCGWIKDKYGLSWQVSPMVLNDMMNDADPAALVRITRAVLDMKKIDLAALEKAYRGEM